MKKLVLMIVMLIVSVTTMHANAFEPQYHRFLKPSCHDRLSDAEFREALKMLFLGQNESKYWNGNTPGGYPEMRRMYAEHLKLKYNLKELPTPEAMAALVDISTTVSVPSTVKTAGIVKSTGGLQYFSRPALPNEKGLEQGGIIWGIESCGNPGDMGSLRITPVRQEEVVEEEFDRPTTIKKEFASHREDWDDNRSKSSNTITINTVAPTPSGNTGGGMSSEMMMWMMMNQRQNQQPAYAPPAEVIVKNKANAWDVIAGVTGVANLGLNIYDLVRRPKVVTYANDYYGGGNRYPVIPPSRPGRPVYPNDPQYPTTPPWQGGSGYYPNPAYDNTNASGLGAGDGTIWGGGNTTTGQPVYRLPVDRTYEW